MEQKERAEINEMLSSENKISSSMGNLLKTPKRLKVNIDDLEMPNQIATCSTNTEVESSLKLVVEIPSQEVSVLNKDESPEPEIKKRKRGRPNTKEDKTVVPMKKRSSSRSTKGKHSNYRLFEISDAKADNRPKNAVGVLDDDDDDEENLLALVHDVKAKTNVITSNANGMPVSNGTPTALSTQKPAVGTLGTARKRVGGDGKVASLQRIMLELPNLCDPNVFTDILIKTYGSKFEASKVFECLNTGDLKEAVIKKFTPSELMALIQRSGNAIGMLLAIASTEEILHEVKSREELRNSEKFLNMVLTKKFLNKEKVVNRVLDAASVDAIVNKVNSRSDLKSSEKLFSVLLQNLPEKISEETKETVIKVLIEKFTTSELVDISHEAIRSSVEKYQKN